MTTKEEQYTPATVEVREAYQYAEEGLDFKRIFNSRGEEFDRWLTQIRYEAYSLGVGDGGIQCWDWPEEWGEEPR